MVRTRSDDNTVSYNSDGAGGAACRPPRGKTYLTIGQDFFSVEEYVLSQYNASLHRPDGHNVYSEVGNSRRKAPILPLPYFYPAATMVYTDIHELKGLDQPADYGSGIEYVKGLADAFPESGLQIGLWLNGSAGCRDIVSGVLDDQTYRLFDFIRSELPESLPRVFLRVGYEFDNPWFGYSDDPAAYQEAFRKIVNACERQMTTKQCHEKVDFVWHSWAAPREDTLSLDQFYPGDYFVDWVGVSIFQQVYPWANDEKQNEKGNFAGGDMKEVKEVLEFATSKGIPIMIAESTPFGGMDVAESDVARQYIKDDANKDDVWNMWFQKTIDLIEEFDISMWSYINCDWGSQPMWHGVGFGDTRISSSKVVMKRWWEQVLSNDSRFLVRIEDCNENSRPRGHIREEDEMAVARSATTAIDGLFHSDGSVNYMTSNPRCLQLLCIGGVLLVTVAFLFLLQIRLWKTINRRHCKERASRPNCHCTHYGAVVYDE